MNMDFGIINYNGGDALIECIQSVYAMDYPCRVYVFDNASHSFSPGELQKMFPHLEIVQSAKNLGYAGAINGLIKRMESPLQVLMNMDLSLDPNWAKEIASTFQENPEVDSVGSLVIETGEPPLINSCGVLFYKDMHPQSIGSGTPYTGQEKFNPEIFGSYGAIMAFRKEVFEEIQFDEDYFLFYEETDFFLRFRLLDKKILMNSKAIAWHYRSLATKRYSLPKLFFSERNRVQTILKLTPVWFWFYAQFYTLLRFFKMSKQKPVGNEKGAENFPSKYAILWTLCKAWSAAWLALPVLLKKRKEFWMKTTSQPKCTLKLLKKYQLDKEELSLR